MTTFCLVRSDTQISATDVPPSDGLTKMAKAAIAFRSRPADSSSRFASSLARGTTATSKPAAFSSPFTRAVASVVISSGVA